MILGRNMRLETDWKEDARETLSPLLDYRINGNSIVPAVGRSALYKALVLLAGLAAAIVLLIVLID